MSNHPYVIGLNPTLTSKLWCLKCSKRTDQGYMVSVGLWCCTKCGETSIPFADRCCPECESERIKYEEDIDTWMCFDCDANWKEE